MVELIIDGRQVTSREGSSIIEAAAGVGIDIPNLCYDDTLSVAAACRLCVVEVEGRAEPRARLRHRPRRRHGRPDRVRGGRRRPPPHPRSAALRPPQRLHHLRAGRRLPAAGVLLPLRCRAKRATPARPSSLPIESDEPPDRARHEQVHPLRQVRARLPGGAGHRRHRLHRTRLRVASSPASFDRPLDISFCRFCGQCVDLCPTGALTNKQLKGTRRWDRTKVRTTCPFCGVGCNFDLNVADGQVVGVTAAYDAPGEPGLALRQGPLPRRPHQQPRPHHDAAHQARRRLRGGHLGRGARPGRRAAPRDQGRDGPDAIGVLSSARCTNEENYLLQRLTRAGLNTNSIDHCART